MAKKLNSMRFLESHGVAYEAIEFDDNIHDAVELAEAVGVSPHLVYKTLVVDTGEKNPVLALIAADRRLDVKALAKAAGYKKLSMASHADAEKWTGLKTGGISPLALTSKNWAVFLDTPAEDLPHILLSAGQRGLNLRLATADLIRVLRPTLATISDL